MRLYHSLFLLLLLVIPVKGDIGECFSSTLAISSIAIDNDPNISYARELVNDLIPKFSVWRAGFTVIALNIFGILVVLDFIWIIIQSILDGKDSVKEMLQTLGERILVYGISFLVITEGPTLGEAAIAGLHGLALGVAPGAFNESDFILSITIISAVIVVVAVLGTALSCFWLIFFPLTFEPLWAQILIFLMLVTVGLFTTAIVQSVILYIELMIMLAFSPIIFALGGLKMTSAVSGKFIKQCIGGGIQLIALVCILEALADVLITLFTDITNANFIGFVKIIFGLYLLSFCIKSVPATLATLALGVSAGATGINTTDTLKNTQKKLNKIKAKSPKQYFSNRGDKLKARRAKSAASKAADNLPSA